MRIAIVGGGPAGARAAALLAPGHEVTLFDAQGPWEKPCGGGVTPRAMAELDPGAAESVPHCRPERLGLYSGRCAAEIVLEDPPRIFSRKELGKYLVEAATGAGVRFVRDRVTGLRRSGGEWLIQTRQDDAVLAADFVLGADGATSFVRRTLGEPFGSEDLLATAGYFVPYSGLSRMAVYFRRELDGYMWSFPRPDHVSFGLIIRPRTGWATWSRSVLEVTITADLGDAAFREAVFYSSPVPCLRPQTWEGNTIAGDGWALLGDAAGLVDPITGEGIFYAFRSARLFAETFPNVDDYARAIAEECFADLSLASRMYRRFYGGRFLGRDFRERMVQFAAVSPALRAIVGDLVSGSQGYRGLKRRLARSAPRVGLDLARRAVGLGEKKPRQ